MNRKVWFYAALTFAAITVANLISIKYGPSASVFNAFFLIGLVLVTRDAIHDELSGWRLTAFLGGLIAAGGAAAYSLTSTLSSAPPEIAEAIAKASMLAFMAAETVDAIVYQLARRQKWTVRANLSNIPAAAVDSVIFAWVAFNAPWSVGGAQFFAKVVGGIVWVYVIGRVRDAAAGHQRRQDAYAV